MPKRPRQPRPIELYFEYGAGNTYNLQKPIEEAGSGLQQIVEPNGHDDPSRETGGLGCTAEAACQQWIEFAGAGGHLYLTSDRAYNSDLERINAIEAEENSLFAFARSKGLDGVSLLEGLTAYKPRAASGSEHRVYFDGKDRVLKRTKAGKYGQRMATPFEYMDRLALMNAIYPALDIRFEDCLKNEKGEFSILTSMRSFPGPHPTGKEVDKFLKGEGFEVLDDGSGTMDYIHHAFGLILRDCHAQNWVVDRGMMVPIDIIPELVR